MGLSAASVLYYFLLPGLPFLADPFFFWAELALVFDFLGVVRLALETTDVSKVPMDLAATAARLAEVVSLAEPRLEGREGPGTSSNMSVSSSVGMSRSMTSSASFSMLFSQAWMPLSRLRIKERWARPYFEKAVGRTSGWLRASQAAAEGVASPSSTRMETMWGAESPMRQRAAVVGLKRGRARSRTTD